MTRPSVRGTKPPDSTPRGLRSRLLIINPETISPPTPPEFDDPLELRQWVPFLEVCKSLTMFSPLILVSNFYYLLPVIFT